MKKPVIFFDWDGTLCDSMELCIQENRITLEKMGLPAVPVETLRRCNGPTYPQGAPILGVPAERTEEYCRIRLETALAIVPQVNRLYDGARELLHALQEHAELCIVSNAAQGYLTQCLQLFRLEGVFSHVVAARPDRTKTQNLAALIALLQPERAVMVGDRLGDLVAGQENHLPTIAACYGYGSAEEYAFATWQADSVTGLQELLLRFCAE